MDRKKRNIIERFTYIIVLYETSGFYSNSKPICFVLVSILYATSS